MMQEKKRYRRMEVVGENRKEVQNLVDAILGERQWAQLEDDAVFILNVAKCDVTAWACNTGAGHASKTISSDCDWSLLVARVMTIIKSYSLDDSHTLAGNRGTSPI